LLFNNPVDGERDGLVAVPLEPADVPAATIDVTGLVASAP